MDMISVKRVLDAHWDRHLPVDPVKIASKLGYLIKPLTGWDSIHTSGMACDENGQKVIYIKSDEHHQRKRFTIAHEIGHHFLGHTAGGNHCRDNEQTLRTPTEIQANEFAAELLMPEDVVEMLVKRKGITSIDELAQIFDVSTQAMYWRLKNIGLI